MISLVFTNGRIEAAKHSKNTGSFLFSMPLNLEESGYAGIAKRVKQKLREMHERQKKVSITLMENVVFKEFTHQPVSNNVVSSLAKLEARTTLGEQFEDYAVSYLPYGEMKNEMGEENCMLLATPITLLKCLQTTFAAEGMRLTSVHSGFDAYNAVLGKFAPILMGKKSYATIHIDYESTLINIYSEGRLASQRRLQGILFNVSANVAQASEMPVVEIEEKLKSRDYDDAFFEMCKSSITDFVWDILRTVRVVCAPLRIDLDAFFVSGGPCRDKNLCDIIRDNMGTGCVFADDYVTEGMVGFKKPITGALINIGTCLSKLDLLAPVKIVKKSMAIDMILCIALTVIIAMGMAVQPVAMWLSEATAKDWKTRLDALTPMQLMLERVANANTKITDIANKKAMLTEYTSTSGETVKDVFALMEQNGLLLKSLSYDAITGKYTVQFVAATKTVFLNFKDKIYANTNYFLNLSLSSTQTEEEDYLCTMSFVPVTYKAMPEPRKEEVNQEQPKTSAEEQLESLGGAQDEK